MNSEFANFIIIMQQIKNFSVFCRGKTRGNTWVNPPWPSTEREREGRVGIENRVSVRVDSFKKLRQHEGMSPMNQEVLCDMVSNGMEGFP